MKFVQVFIRTPQTYALLGERENLWRLGALIAGYALIRLGSWQPQPAEPPLVTRCRNHLYRLQTIQMSSATMSAGTSQILSLGSEHSTSVTTVPPNFPELVADFRDLLTRIAEQHSQRGQRVVIAIDEVDRLGSDTQALAFLSEIKAILGVANVHYLISVAEDVGAAFVRRGLPHRDVTDSSLDDVVYVQPNTLDEARAILTKRAPGLSSPYVMLAHALSGGVPRDLIRYALRIMEMKDKADSSELVDISHYLVVEELSETLAGFRTLLSKCQWTAETSTVLQSFRTLGDYLRHSCPCTFDGLRHALEDFAFGPRPGSHTPRPVDNIARQMIDEASTYAYFSLTLLDIFSNTELTRRLQAAAARGPAGDPEQLAEARSELGISAYSARDLTTSIRQAWALPTQPLPTATVPPPRVSACDIH